MRELARDLSVVDLDGPPIHQVLTQRLLTLLRTETSLVVSWRCEDEVTTLDRFGLSGRGGHSAQVIERGLGAWMERAAGAFAFYDPRGPEPTQRNAALEVGSWRALSENRLPAELARAHVSPDERERRAQSVASASALFRTWGNTDAEQLRVLVCEGALCHAWVGVMQHGPFERGARGLLQSLVPAIRRRFAVEDRLCPARAGALVPAVLEEIPTAAYVLDARGVVVAANVLGRRALERDGARGRERLREARGGRSPDAIAIDLAERGVFGYSLVMDRALADRPEAGAALVRARFGLTPRESEVLEATARGWTNRAIAGRLGCGVRTVETHVARILAKTDCASRAELVALVHTSARATGRSW